MNGRVAVASFMSQAAGFKPQIGPTPFISEIEDSNKEHDSSTRECCFKIVQITHFILISPGKLARVIKDFVW